MNLGEGIDPDDTFSSVPYEKGSNFLYYLETKVCRGSGAACYAHAFDILILGPKQLGGPEAMDAFLKAYVIAFSHKSITTQAFQDFVYLHFNDQVLVALWLFHMILHLHSHALSVNYLLASCTGHD